MKGIILTNEKETPFRAGGEKHKAAYPEGSLLRYGTDRDFVYRSHFNKSCPAGLYHFVKCMYNYCIKKQVSLMTLLFRNVIL